MPTTNPMLPNPRHAHGNAVGFFSHSKTNTYIHSKQRFPHRTHEFPTGQCEYYTEERPMTDQRRELKVLPFRSGFTTIELLIVIGVIALLAAMLILGLHSVVNSSKSGATKVTLQALQGMLAELDAKTRLNKAPVEWMWWTTSSTSQLVQPLPGTNDYDLWHIPWRNGLVSAAPVARNPDALDAPGNVSEDNEATRSGSRQVLNTQIVMSMLLGLPTNRSVLQQIPADRYFIPTWVGNLQVPTPGNDAVLLTTDDSSGGENIFNLYLPGAIVQYKGIQYLCVAATNLTPPAPSGTNPWQDLSVTPGRASAPLLLDSWNNPIIFVPATGLRVRMLNGKSANDPTDNTQTTIIISPEGKLDPTKTIVLQPGRPFFASAGPDGDFSRGDDNVYSFEQ
jgi:type II secretory pathway pseudopilin PulG